MSVTTDALKLNTSMKWHDRPCSVSGNDEYYSPSCLMTNLSSFSLWAIGLSWSML